MLFEAGDDAVELAGVARQPVRRRSCRLAMVSFSGSRILRQHGVDLAQRVARGLGHALAGAGFGDQRRHRDRNCASSVPPSSAITGTPVRPWNSRPTLVSARTGVVEATEIVALTRRGLSGASAEIGHLADADAVEQHAGADQQPRHRAVELDVIGGARAEPAGVVQPVDEAEHGDDGRQHEGADDDEGSAGFHRS